MNLFLYLACNILSGNLARCHLHKNARANILRMWKCHEVGQKSFSFFFFVFVLKLGGGGGGGGGGV